MIIHRHILTYRESSQWNHVNPSMARWRQYQIIDRISDEAIVKGFDKG